MKVNELSSKLQFVVTEYTDAFKNLRSLRDGSTHIYPRSSMELERGATNAGLLQVRILSRISSEINSMVECSSDERVTMVRFHYFRFWRVIKVIGTPPSC